CDVPALDVAGLLEAFLDCRDKSRVWSGRYAGKDADHRHRRLLRARRERPRGRRAGEQRDELTPFDDRAHSITSWARAGNGGGGAGPGVLAVLSLITTSTLGGGWSGRSLGLSPLRRRPT